MTLPEQPTSSETLASVTAELQLALDGFRTATRILIEATTKAGDFMPQDLLTTGDIRESEYRELHELWVISPGDEVLSLLGAEE